MQRMTYAEITAAIGVGLPFDAVVQQARLSAHHLRVLTSRLGVVPSSALSGALADRVRGSQRDYTIQYLTDGGRKRLPSDVAYYIAQYDPISCSHYVLTIVTASGTTHHATNAESHPAAPELLAAIIAGLPSAAEVIAQQILHDGELHETDIRSDAGWTFDLFVRRAKSAIRTVQQVATFDNREAAYTAMQEAERVHAGRHAWIERYESGGPLYGVALGHGTFDCLGPDLVTGITCNARQTRRNLSMISIAQPGAEIALAIKSTGDTCFRVDGVPVAEWIRRIADPTHE